MSMRADFSIGAYKVCAHTILVDIVWIFKGLFCDFDLFSLRIFNLEEMNYK